MNRHPLVCYLLAPSLLALLASPIPAAADSPTPATPSVEAPATGPGESQFLRNIQQITFDGKSGEGYFSPDATRIVFQSVRGDHPFYQIFLKPLPAGEEVRISTGQGRTTCAYFHPGEPKLIFSSSHLDPNRDAEARNESQRLAREKQGGPRSGYAWAFDPHMDVFEARLDGSGLRRLTDAPGYDAEASYSPDGQRIVFCSFRKGDGDIWVMDADGGNPRQITDSPGYDGGPFFSPDGRRILFRGEVRRRNYLQLFVINADGTGEKQLTDDGFLNWGPTWHPDGRHVIYATSRHGHRNYELYLLDTQTAQTTRITFTEGADVLPVFSPDGRRLMWTSTRGRNREGLRESQLFIADWVGPGTPGPAPAPAVPPAPPAPTPPTP